MRQAVLITPQITYGHFQTKPFLGSSLLQNVIFIILSTSECNKVHWWKIKGFKQNTININLEETFV